MDHPEMKAVLGNHEYALLLDYKNKSVVLKKSQKKVKNELGKRFGEYMEFVSDWPLMIPLAEDGLVVHAGLRPDLDPDRQSAEDLTNLRTVNGVPWFELYKGNKTVIFGHWVTLEPMVRQKTIGIDTGCVYGGRLTAVIWPEMKFLSIPARENYSS
jgi:hypothetical protein